MRRTIVLDLTGEARLGKDLVATGGVFVADAAIRLDEECNLVLRAGSEELRLVARAVLVNERGAGLEIVGRTSQVRDQIEAFARIATYLVVMREDKTTPGRASRQDTIPTMPPKPEPTAAPPRAKGEIIERVRSVRYGQDDDDRDSLQGRTKTLAGTLADSARRKPASSVSPAAPPSPAARLAAGSIPPTTTPNDAATRLPAAPKIPLSAAPAGKRRDVQIALAPTQDADSLESKALAAQIAAHGDDGDDGEAES